MDLKLLKKIQDYEWEIPKEEGMNVPGKIYASKDLVERMDEKVKEQITNVACLPGIQRASIAMSDAHWGYGFPIGGVGAFDPEDNGVICMGGVGFDISCGVRTMITQITKKEIQPVFSQLVDELYNIVPAGLGSTGEIKLSKEKLDEVLVGGAVWAVEQGYGIKDDLNYIEEFGKIDGAKPENVSDIAKKRQYKQVGTLGSGNHYLEIQYVDEIYDKEAAKTLGLEKDKIIVSIHCGSRALGHQIGMDYLKELGEASKKYNIPIKDRELACAPIKSREGERYFSAMTAGINCALANRQVIAHLVRQGFDKIIPEAKIKMLYDISHNTCKVEQHKVNGEKKTLYVHRKGATRAFGPNRKEIPKQYQKIGQPVLIGGTMGTYSYVMTGMESGDKGFESACHGAGRCMSRTQAKRTWFGENVVKDLQKQGIIVKGHSHSGIAEEAPGAYKDVREVVDSIHNAKLAKKIVRVRPLASIKG